MVLPHQRALPPGGARPVVEQRPRSWSRLLCHSLQQDSEGPEPVVQRHRGHWRPVPHEQPEAQLQTHPPHVVPEKDCGLHVLRGLEGSTCPPLSMMILLSTTTYRSCQSRVLTVLSLPHLQVLKKHPSLLRLDLSFQVAVSERRAERSLRRAERRTARRTWTASASGSSC